MSPSKPASDMPPPNMGSDMGPMPASGDEDPMDSQLQSEAEEMAAEDMISAFNAGDASTLKDALKRFIDVCYGGSGPGAL